MGQTELSQEQVDVQVREKEREREQALRAKMAREATIYATIFDQVRLRLEPFTKWEEREIVAPAQEGTLLTGDKYALPARKVMTEKIPPLLNGSDLKDVATSIYIALSRGVSWNR